MELFHFQRILKKYYPILAIKHDANIKERTNQTHSTHTSQKNKKKNQHTMPQELTTRRGDNLSYNSNTPAKWTQGKNFILIRYFSKETWSNQILINRKLFMIKSHSFRFCPQVPGAESFCGLAHKHIRVHRCRFLEM